MKKRNIPLKDNEANLKLLLDITKEVGKNTDTDISYNNINLINHIPFGDKKNKDIEPRVRFKSQYRTNYAKSAKKEFIVENCRAHKEFREKRREFILQEHFYLGKQSREQEKANLNSEK